MDRHTDYKTDDAARMAALINALAVPSDTIYSSPVPDA